MKKILHFIIILFIFQLFFQNNANSQLVLDSVFKKEKVLFEVGIATPIAITSKEFFDKYQSQYLKGTKSQFKTGIQFHGAFKWLYSDYYTFGISADFFQSKIQDVYTLQYISSRDIPYNRTYLQSIIVNTIPVFITCEITPVISQFKSYCGFGVGASTGYITWWEEVHSDLYDDIRIGGKHIDDNIIAPAVKAYVGVQLGFDDKKMQNVVNSFILEVSTTYIHRNVDFFGKVKEQFDTPPDIFNENTFIIPFYISLAAYISFNLERL